MRVAFRSSVNRASSVGRPRRHRGTQRRVITEAKRKNTNFIFNFFYHRKTNNQQIKVVYKSYQTQLRTIGCTDASKGRRPPPKQRTGGNNRLIKGGRGIPWPPPGRQARPKIAPAFYLFIYSCRGGCWGAVMRLASALPVCR